MELNKKVSVSSYSGGLGVVVVVVLLLLLLWWWWWWW